MRELHDSRRLERGDSPRKSRILDLLLCLNCGATLSWEPQVLRCPGCAAEYPLQEGIPVVLPECSRIVHELPPRSRRGFVGAFKSVSGRLVELLTGPPSHVVIRENMKFLRDALPADASILLLGGGVVRYGNGIEVLGPEQQPGIVNLDVKPGPVVDIVADGHQVPLPDGLFDLVVSQAVLEHVADPDAMLREIWRLVKPGGLVFVDVPFLQPVHMHSDFWRFTLMGLEEKLRDYEKIRSGTNGGVGSAAGLVGVQFWAAMLSFGSRSVHRALLRALPVLFWPLSHLDPFFQRRGLPPLAPSAVYFIGRRPAKAGETAP